MGKPNTKKGAELELHYATLLRELSTAKGIFGQLFTKSQNKIQDPAMLAKIIDMIESEQWLKMLSRFFTGILKIQVSHLILLTLVVFQVTVITGNCIIRPSDRPLFSRTSLLTE